MDINRLVICKIVITSIALLQFIKPFISIDIAKVTFLLGMLLFFTYTPLMGKSFKKTAIIFFLLGTILLLFGTNPLETIIAGTNSMLNIIAIIIVMQLFTIPIKTGRYNEAIEYFLSKKLKSKSGLYLFTMIVTHVFSSFLLFGTIPVMLSLMGDSIKRKVRNYQQFVSTAISRGYALVILWAPGAVNILLVMQATGTKWIDLFLPGLFLSLLGLVTSFLMERKYNMIDPEQYIDREEYETRIEPKKARNKVGHIILVVCALLLLTAFMENINFASSANRIMMAGLLIVISWSMMYRQNKDFKVNIIEYWKNDVGKNLDLATLFVAIGIFAEAIGSVGIINVLEESLLSYGDSIYPYTLFIIPLTIVLCSVVGIHPYISIVMVGKLIGTLTLPFSKISLALALGVGGSISYIISPFAGIVLTLSKFIDCSPGQISLKWNKVFGIVYLIESTVFIYIYNIIIT